MRPLHPEGVCLVFQESVTRTRRINGTTVLARQFNIGTADQQSNQAIKGDKKASAHIRNRYGQRYEICV